MVVQVVQDGPADLGGRKAVVCLEGYAGAQPSGGKCHEDRKGQVTQSVQRICTRMENAELTWSSALPRSWGWASDLVEPAWRSLFDSIERDGRWMAMAGMPTDCCVNGAGRDGST